MIGVDATMALARSLGGRRVYVPSEFPQNHPVTQVIGAEAAHLLAERFKSGWLLFPVKQRRRAMIASLAAQRPRLSNSEIAWRAGASERFVYKVLAELAGPDSRQIEMFGDS